MKCHWLFTVKSHSSAEVWLAGKPQASCDRMLGSQQQGIKCRRFYYNMRSTIQLTLRPQALLHLRLAMAPRLTSGSTGQLWRARNHSLKSVDADGLMDLKSTALISKSNVSWFEISLLDNWYNKFWKHCTFHQCSFLNQFILRQWRWVSRLPFFILLIIKCFQLKVVFVFESRPFK